MEERVKARYFIIPFLCVVFENIMHYFGYDRIAKGIYWLAAVSVVWIFIQTIYYGQAMIIKRYTDYAREIKGLSKDQWLAFGIRFPHIRMKFSSLKPIEFFEDTNATMDHFDYYLRSSNGRQVSPLRGWKSAEYPARVWHEITDYLVKNGQVRPDSASGNHSHLWIGDWQKRLWQTFLTRDLINLGEQSES